MKHDLEAACSERAAAMPRNSRWRSGVFLNVVSCLRTILLLGGMMSLAVCASEREVVINEIMYHSPYDLEELQYVELFNPGEKTVDLSDWQIKKGIKFTFPAGSSLGPANYAVICRNKTLFTGQYGRDISILGEFAGKLSHRGEQLLLVDARGQVVDTVRYGDHAPWPSAADGGSSSLERICPSEPGREAWNWAASALPDFKRPAGTPGRKNDSFSEHLPPIVSDVRYKTPAPGEKVVVTAQVAAEGGVEGVTLLWRLAGRGAEKELVMERLSGDEKQGVYQAVLEGQPEGQVVRFRIRAAGRDGAIRLQPSPHELRPTYTYSTFVNTNTAQIAFGYVVNYASSKRTERVQLAGGKQVLADPTRGDGSFIYVPPGSGEVITFDHVQTRTRPDGFKVHFAKDQPLHGMTGVNILFGASPRQILSEPLAFELFRLAGVPSPMTEHLRIWIDGQCRGYQLLIEQPNKVFLARIERDTKGSLYKLIWQGHSIVGQHEKKTRETEGHDDLVQVIQGLDRTGGIAQWEFIRQHFNVEEWINYYAVSMAIQNWDGFWNNYYAYHDSGDTGKWEIYPWDEDKTWGDCDGAQNNYQWYDMPLTFGMKGDRPPSSSRFSMDAFNGGPHGGPSWWRRPGWFSGPLLANPEFRKRFLARLGELCQTNFTEQQMRPLIDAMEHRLEPEVPIRAQSLGRNVDQERARFQRHLQSFRNQVKNRRAFILKNLEAQRPLTAGGQALRDRLAGGLAIVLIAGLVAVWLRSRTQVQLARLPVSTMPPPLPPFLPPVMPPPLPPAVQSQRL